MTQFFKKFPLISYDGSPAINLLSRVKMSKLALNTRQAYYPYTIVEGERPDNLAYNYYSNSDYFWLVGLANSIVDPYYDFPISSENINQLIINKYGSIANAQKTILFFRTNWANDQSRISTAAYAGLGVGQKKYWAPEVNQNNGIMAYIRKKEDLVVTTNKVQHLSINNANFNLLTESNYEITTEDTYNIVVDYTPETVTDAAFVAGELVSQNGVTFATVVTASETTLVIQHTYGTAVTGEITGLTSGASGTVATVTTVNQNIPSDELVYWEAVSAYNYQNELNNEKKQIQLLDNKYSGQATKELKTLLST